MTLKIISLRILVRKKFQVINIHIVRLHYILIDGWW